jgi:hypothetical protein
MALQGAKVIQMNLYDLKHVGPDFITVADADTELKITFADREDPYDDLAPKREDSARFFSGIKCQVGLEAPVIPFHTKRSMDIFLDHEVAAFGTLRSVPFPFTVASLVARRP